MQNERITDAQPRTGEDTKSRAQTKMQSPTWMRQLAHYLPICPQIVLSGNVRDVHLVPTNDGQILIDTLGAIRHVLKSEGIKTVLIADPIDGIRCEDAPEGTDHIGEHKLPKARGEQASSETVRQWIEILVQTREPACALIIDYAGQIATTPEQPEPEAKALFAAAQKAAHTAPALRGGNAVAYNPVIWIAERASEMPSWLCAGNDRIRTVTASLPDRTTREAAADTLLIGLDHGDAERKNASERFARLTEGLTLRAMTQIRTLAKRNNTALSELADTVRAYKVGITDNPWAQPYLRKAVRNAKETLCRDVKGQPEAVAQVADILTRCVTGLSGAQTGAEGTRPRGVLFFAGPTGTGKTELARAIARVVFGGEDALIRFDMSEFATEQAGERLTGAPPGYVGYDAGGELVNAVRERPFSVVLLDEIEKAHGRILDRFLQVLDAGRLTDARGSTVYFSECIIVFTSNIGIHREHKGERVANVSPSDDTATVRTRVREAVEETLRFDLGRPELLNRIGENIVVFDFIRAKSADAIFDKQVDAIMERVAHAHRVHVRLAPAADEALRSGCLNDLGHGGRGIGNQLEARLVNPLARSLFEKDATDEDPNEKQATHRYLISEASTQNGQHSVRLEPDRDATP